MKRINTAFKLVKAWIRNKIGILQPIILAHMVTFRCNMRCHYCDYWRRNSYEMNLREIERMLKEASDLDVAIYTATGGEPLIRKDICSILNLANDYGFYTLLITNGLKLKGKNLNVDIVTISLDTLRRDRFYRITGVDALDKVIDSIKWASNVYDVCINVVLHEDNADEVEELVRFADECNVYITFEPVSAYFQGCPDIGDENLKSVALKLLKLKKEYKCILNSREYLKLIASGGKFNCLSNLLIRINPDGELIAPCYDISFVRVGNVRVKSLKDLLSSSKYKRGLELAKKCRHRCYLLCYAEPSLVFSSFMYAIRWLFDFFLKMQ
jgi:MoaA/NifB/PqqE/SkfB family radical SAM enzyme